MHLYSDRGSVLITVSVCAFVFAPSCVIICKLWLTQHSSDHSRFEHLHTSSKQQLNDRNTTHNQSSPARRGTRERWSGPSDLHTPPAIGGFALMPNMCVCVFAAGRNSRFKNCLPFHSWVELVTSHRMLNWNLNWSGRKRNLFNCTARKFKSHSWEISLHVWWQIINNSCLIPFLRFCRALFFHNSP